MAKTFRNPGKFIKVVAPTGGVTAGTPVQIGQLFGIPTTTAAEAAEFELHTVGVHDIPKVGSQAWTAGQLIYWDKENNRATSVATGSLLIGCAVAPLPGSGAGETTGRVRLNGAARADEA